MLCSYLEVRQNYIKMIRLLVLLAEKLNFTLVIKASVDVFLKTVFKLKIVKLRSRSRLGSGQVQHAAGPA